MPTSGASLAIHLFSGRRRGGMARTGTVRLCHLPVVVWFPRNAREAGEHTHPTNLPVSRCFRRPDAQARRRPGSQGQARPSRSSTRDAAVASSASARKWGLAATKARASESAVRFVSACSRHRPRRRQRGVPARDAVHAPRPSTSSLSPRRHPRAPAMGPARDGVRAGGGARHPRPARRHLGRRRARRRRGLHALAEQVVQLVLADGVFDNASLKLKPAFGGQVQDRDPVRRLPEKGLIPVQPCC